MSEPVVEASLLTGQRGSAIVLVSHTYKPIAKLPGAGTPMPGFGASDCGCRSHLIWFQERPVPTITGIEVWRPAS